MVLIQIKETYFKKEFILCREWAYFKRYDGIHEMLLAYFAE